MKALARCKAGGPETLVLEELPEPVVGPDQVRIAVRACAVRRICFRWTNAGPGEVEIVDYH
jgi:NADPH:quinone reductase-like Zn-dependent oxidoreductase